MTDTPSPATTRLAPAGYLSQLAADAALLRAAVVAAPDAPVPGCPGWAALDVLEHVSAVYRHKTLAIRTGRQPSESSPADPDPGRDPYAAFDAALADVLAELEGHDADSPAWTWWPAEQTVGFWQRRMAQETLIHRMDAQQAACLAGAAGEPDPMASDLAIDGVDELLGWLEYPWDEFPLEAATGQRVTVAASGSGWTWDLRFDRTSVRVQAAGPGGPGSPDPDATLSGPADALLLDLWGRPARPGTRPGAPVRTQGDQAAVRLLRERLAMATG